VTLAGIVTDFRTRRTKKGELMTNFVTLQDDGTTSCGNWLYCASYTEAGNMSLLDWQPDGDQSGWIDLPGLFDRFKLKSSFQNSICEGGKKDC
jgi:hypothetical protein